MGLGGMHSGGADLLCERSFVGMGVKTWMYYFYQEKGRSSCGEPRLEAVSPKILYAWPSKNELCI